jgi:hypothetical protein
MHWRSHPDNFWCFVYPDETAGSWRIIGMDIQRYLDSCTQGSDHRDLQIAHWIDAIGTQALQQFKRAGITLPEMGRCFEDHVHRQRSILTHLPHKP